MTWFPIYADLIATPQGPPPAVIIAVLVCVAVVVVTVVLLRVFKKSKK